MQTNLVRVFAFSLVTLVASSVFAADVAKKPALTTPEAKASYAIGMSIGQNFKAQGVEVDPKIVALGLSDALTKGATPLMDAKTIQTTMAAFQKELLAKREKQYKEVADKNLKAGKDFLSENAKKEGVKTADDGLQYKIIKKGTGKKPTGKDFVSVNYEGKLIDGKVFDSSYKRGKPVKFKVSQVIPGWTQALKMMHVGAVWQVFIPAKLAYGEHGIGGMIGPNETLIFKIELLKIIPDAAAKKVPASA